MKNLLFLSLAVILLSCGANKTSLKSDNASGYISSENIPPFFETMEVSTDDSYGLSSEKPVKVGEKSASNQRRYIASLAGPNGEVLSFYRIGSCCAYKSENGYGGTALIDKYSVTYEGLAEPIVLYISFYDLEDLLIPVGFTKRKP